MFCWIVRSGFFAQRFERMRLESKKEKRTLPLGIVLFFFVALFGCVPFGIGGKPTFMNALLLLVQFFDAPQAGDAQDAQKQRAQSFRQERSDETSCARSEKRGPDFFGKIVFAPDYDRMEYANQ